MSRKCNTKHSRSRTNEERGYRKRLIQRGLSKAPMLAEIEGDSGLRRRQERRIRETCSIPGDHSHHDPCNGIPFPFASELHDSDLELGSDE